MDVKFGVLMFTEIRERLESFRVRKIIFFLLWPFETKKRICIFSLCMETKIPIRLNIFDTKVL